MSGLVSLGGVISSAGKLDLSAVPALDPRKEAIRAVRKILRDPAASDDQVDDALEALVELTKD